MGAFGKMVASWLKSAAKQAAAADRIPRYVRVIYREMGDMRPVVAGRSKLYVFRWPFRVEPTWGGWVRVPGLDVYAHLFDGGLDAVGERMSALLSTVPDSYRTVFD